jgi:hypothetical protein
MEYVYTKESPMNIVVLESEGNPINERHYVT